MTDIFSGEILYEDAPNRFYIFIHLNYRTFVNKKNWGNPQKNIVG